jgi:serine/threonine protein kinase
MDNVDLATTALILKAVSVEANDAFQFLSNKAYLIPNLKVKEQPLKRHTSREGTPLCEVERSICALDLIRKPFDPAKGWVFGSDNDEEVDFRLAKNSKTGVSGQHFRISYNPQSKCLVLTNISKHHTLMSSPKIGDDLKVRESMVILSSEQTEITAGAVTISLRVPNRKVQQPAFEKHLASYLQELQAALPRLPGLALEPPQRDPTQRETPLVVLGKRNRVPYIIEKEGDLGAGSFGIVSRALDARTGDLYAAKKFRHITPRVRMELDINEKISHVSNVICQVTNADFGQDYIVKVLDIQEDPESPLLIMEYCEGGNLRQHEDLSEGEIMDMFEQQLKALNYLHKIGITHRDIKPENILVQSRFPELVTKLADFGFSTDSEWMKTACGTGMYLAPELAIKPLKYTKAVDIWALGVVGLQFCYSLPNKPRSWSIRDWTDKIERHARAYNGILSNLLLIMLDILPLMRPSAENCLAELSSCNPRSLSPSSPAPKTARPISKPRRWKKNGIIHIEPNSNGVPDIFGNGSILDYDADGDSHRLKTIQEENERQTKAGHREQPHFEEK